MLMLIFVGTLDIKPMKERSVTAGVISALDGLTRGLAVDLAPLRVNVIGPGPVSLFKYNSLTTLFADMLVLD